MPEATPGSDPPADALAKDTAALEQALSGLKLAESDCQSLLELIASKSKEPERNLAAEKSEEDAFDAMLVREMGELESEESKSSSSTIKVKASKEKPTATEAGAVLGQEPGRRGASSSATNTSREPASGGDGSSATGTKTAGNTGSSTKASEGAGRQQEGQSKAYVEEDPFAADLEREMELAIAADLAALR
ncbi:unnamed protein product [Amoebophrya sp. A120]|nr:unnamed protein product [Amoebophrya sp. A120]|eukprot:GSA120T00018860001.1